MLTYRPAYYLLGGAIGIAAGAFFPNQIFWFYSGVLAFGCGVYAVVKGKKR